MARRRFLPTFLYLTAGLVVWAARFLVVYSLTGILCARGAADDRALGFALVPLVIVAATAVSVAVLLPVLLRAGANLRHRNSHDENALDGFIHAVAALVAGLAILAMVWETIPAFTVPVCA